MYKYKDRFPKFSVFQYITRMAVKKTTYRVLIGGNLKKKTDHLEDLAQKLEDNIKIYLKCEGTWAKIIWLKFLGQKRASVNTAA